MTGKELADALVRTAALVRRMADVGSLELEILPRATLRVRSPNAERQKRFRERNESNAKPVTDVAPNTVTTVTQTVTKVTPPATDPPFPPHTPPIPPERKDLPDQGISSLSLLLPDQPESTGSPRARVAKRRPRAALPEGLTASADSWSSEHTARLLAIGRDPLREDEQFIAYHRAQGTLSASWQASRTTWVSNAEKGYGASRTQTTQLGLVTQVRSRTDMVRENIDRQRDRARQLLDDEERERERKAAGL